MTIFHFGLGKFVFELPPPTLSGTHALESNCSGFNSGKLLQTIVQTDLEQPASCIECSVSGLAGAIYRFEVDCSRSVLGYE